MTPRYLAWRIVGLTLLTLASLGAVVALWADGLIFNDVLRRPAPVADRLQDRLPAGSWQIRTTDGVIDISVAATAWQSTMNQAALHSDLSGAAGALDQLETQTGSLRTGVAGPLLHPDDQADRTDIHRALALIEPAIALQRAAVAADDPAGYVAAGADIEDGLDLLTGTYGRGRR